MSPTLHQPLCCIEKKQRWKRYHPCPQVARSNAKFEGCHLIQKARNMWLDNFCQKTQKPTLILLSSACSFLPSWHYLVTFLLSQKLSTACLIAKLLTCIVYISVTILTSPIFICLKYDHLGTIRWSIWSVVLVLRQFPLNFKTWHLTVQKGCLFKRGREGRMGR